jgi:hypothetical protein
MTRTTSPFLVAALLLAAIVVGGGIGAAAARAARPATKATHGSQEVLPMPGLDRLVSRLAAEARAE